jgi:Domain of unknown function DUF11/Secretion system C-terminal sorting domain
MKTKQILVLMTALMLSFSLSAQWVQQNTPAMNGLYRMHAVNRNTLWTPNVNLGNLDTVHKPQFIRTGDGGKTYKLGQLDIDYLYGYGFIEPVDGKTAYLMAGSVSSPNFYFRRTTDSGATWQDMPYHPTTYPGLIHFYDANNGIYVGDPDSLGFFAAYTTNGGNTFTRIPQTNLPRPDADEYTNLGNFQVLGDNLFLETYYFNPESFYLQKRIMRSTDRGRNWTLGAWAETGDVFETRFCFSDANNGVMLRGIGTLDMKSPLYTTDGGASWHESGKYPGLVSYPIDNIPNTQTMMAIFQDTVRGVTFTAATNDLGKTWNSRKDIGPSVLDRRYADVLGLHYYVNGQLEIVDNNTAWAQFSNTAIHKYENATPLVPEKPDLDLELTADNNGLPLYNSIKYTLTVRNRGISPATGVRINWLPPYKRTNNGAGAYAYQASYADNGRYDGWNGVWTLDRIEAGGTATATFHLFVVNNTQNVTQTAQVVACNESDIDSSPNNMGTTSREDDEVSYVARAINSTAEMPNAAYKGKVDDFTVSPNPAKDKINVSINAEIDVQWTIRVMNSIGQTVFSRQGQNVWTVDIDTRRFENGLYLVEYQSDGERKIEKIIIEH